jgi:hypothetical protein
MWLADKVVTLLWFFVGFKVLNYLEYRIKGALKKSTVKPLRFLS